MDLLQQYGIVLDEQSEENRLEKERHERLIDALIRSTLAQARNSTEEFIEVSWIFAPADPAAINELRD